MKIKLPHHLVFVFVLGLVACRAQDLPAPKPSAAYASPQDFIADLEADGVLSCRDYQDATPVGAARSGIAAGYCMAARGDDSPVPLMVITFAAVGISTVGRDGYIDAYQESMRAANRDPILLYGPNWVATSTRETLIAIQEVIGGSLRE